MKKLIIISLLIASCSTSKVCKDCGMTNCIYQQINDNVKGNGSDSDIMQSIDEVCRKRNIRDSSTIHLIMSNYYL